MPVALDPALAAPLKAQSLTALSADAALQAAVPAARASTAACLLDDATQAALEAIDQRQLLARGMIPGRLTVAGDQRALLFKAVAIAAGVRLVGGRRAFVRGVLWDAATDRTDLALIVEA